MDIRRQQRVDNVAESGIVEDVKPQRVMRFRPKGNVIFYGPGGDRSHKRFPEYHLTPDYVVMLTNQKITPKMLKVKVEHVNDDHDFSKSIHKLSHAGNEDYSVYLPLKPDFSWRVEELGFHTMTKSARSDGDHRGRLRIAVVNDEDRSLEYGHRYTDPILDAITYEAVTIERMNPARDASVRGGTLSLAIKGGSEVRKAACGGHCTAHFFVDGRKFWESDVRKVSVSSVECNYPPFADVPGQIRTVQVKLVINPKYVEGLTPEIRDSLGVEAFNTACQTLQYESDLLSAVPPTPAAEARYPPPTLQNSGYNFDVDENLAPAIAESSEEDDVTGRPEFCQDRFHDQDPNGAAEQPEVETEAQELLIWGIENYHAINSNPHPLPPTSNISIIIQTYPDPDRNPANEESLASVRYPSDDPDEHEPIEAGQAFLDEPWLALSGEPGPAFSAQSEISTNLMVRIQPGLDGHIVSIPDLSVAPVIQEGEANLLDEASYDDMDVFAHSPQPQINNALVGDSDPFMEAPDGVSSHQPADSTPVDTGLDLLDTGQRGVTLSFGRTTSPVRLTANRGSVVPFEPSTENDGFLAGVIHPSSPEFGILNGNAGRVIKYEYEMYGGERVTSSYCGGAQSYPIAGERHAYDPPTPEVIRWSHDESGCGPPNKRRTMGPR